MEAWAGTVGVGLKGGAGGSSVMAAVPLWLFAAREAVVLLMGGRKPCSFCGGGNGEGMEDKKSSLAGVSCDRYMVGDQYNGSEWEK